MVMSIWKRIADAISALVDGEPLSAVFEKLTTPPERTVGFTIAVIALGAKMAKADGLVKRSEVAAFRHIFTIPRDEEAHAAKIFNMARTDVSGFDVYAQQIARMFDDRPEILADLLEGLVYIAMADGSFTLAMECRPNSLEGDNLNLSMDGQYTIEGYVADAEYAYDQGTDREFRFLVRQTARYLGPCGDEEGAAITGG